MTASEVEHELQRFEQLCRDRGAINVTRMGPGLTPDQLRVIEERHNLRLPEDATAVWSWHNGAAAAEMCTTPFWGAGRYFFDLETSIADAKMRLDIRNDGDVFRYPESRWLTLSFSTIARVIDITDPLGTDALVLVSDATASPEEFPIVSIATQIRWWNLAIESGVWALNEEGRWVHDQALWPTGPERLLM